MADTTPSGIPSTPRIKKGNKSSFTPEQLAAQQKKVSMGIQGLGGVSALVAQNQAMQSQAAQIQTNAPGEQEDAYGKPTYNLGTFAQSTAAIHPQDAQADEVLTGIGSGASTGASIGSFIPGLGTLAGGAIGGIIGGISSIFGGNARKTEQENKKRLAEANLRMAQNKFNSSMMQFNNQQAAQNQYNDLNNTDQRMQNLYSYNTQYG